MVCLELGQIKLDSELDLRLASPDRQRIWMRREHQDSEYSTREIARQVGVGQKKESNSEERGSTIQICLHETFVFGPRQVRLCRNSEAFGPENK